MKLPNIFKKREKTDFDIMLDERLALHKEKQRVLHRFYGGRIRKKHLYN